MLALVARCIVVELVLFGWVGLFTGALLLADRGHGRHKEEV